MFLDVIAVLLQGKAMKEGRNHMEPFGLVRLYHYGDHFAVQVHVRIIRDHQLLESLEPLLAVKEFPSGRNVIPEMLILESQFIQDDGGPVGPKAVAVEANIQKPVIFVVRFFGGGVDQIPSVGIILFHPDFGFQRTHLIQTKNMNAIRQIQGRERNIKFPVRIVPEDDSMTFFIEQAG